MDGQSSESNAKGGLRYYKSIIANQLIRKITYKGLVPLQAQLIGTHCNKDIDKRGSEAIMDQQNIRGDHQKSGKTNGSFEVENGKKNRNQKIIVTLIAVQFLYLFYV